jgi:hypothetical protein
MADEWLAPRRVPVHYHETVITLGGQEWLADPKQIVRGLLSQWDARADPGMNEEVRPLAMAKTEVAQEEKMLNRNMVRPFPLGRILRYAPAA